MEILYLALAYLVAILHVSYIAFFLWLVTLSVRGKLRYSKIYQLLFWVWIGGKIASYYILGACVLTLSEQYLRTLATGSSYTVGYIEHYSGLLGISLSAPTIEGLVVTPLVVAILSELYWYWHNRPNPN